MLLIEGDMLEHVGVGEVSPWQKLEEFGVVPIDAVGTKYDELVDGVGVGV